jgi:hypothetical protein
MWGYVCQVLQYQLFEFLNTYFHHPHVVECCIISEWNWFLFKFLLWLMCKDNKSGDLCCIIFASWFVFVGCTCFLSIRWSIRHLISGGKGVAKVVPFDHNLGLNQNFQVDLLMICVYYYVWNLKWKAMCLLMHAFIITLNIGAIIAMVNGQAWNKG